VIVIAGALFRARGIWLRRAAVLSGGFPSAWDACRECSADPRAGQFRADARGVRV